MRKYDWERGPDFHLFLDEARSDECFCLSGCIVNRVAHHNECHIPFEQIKRTYFPQKHTVTSPIILRRKEIANGEPPFRFYTDRESQDFRQSVFDALCAAHFTVICAVVPLDTSLERGLRLLAAYAKALPFVLFRYSGYLHRFKATGDVYAEAIGDRENGYLKSVYSRVRDMEGAEGEMPSYFRAVLTSRHLHVEEKGKNYAGLQVADLLATPMMRLCRSIPAGKPFDLAMAEVAQYKLNKRFCDGLTSEGYGIKVFQK